MGKGDDAVIRKKNKARRKKLAREEGSSAKVSARVASIIAAKKRRLTGKRRQCQGMCFSLPTLDDPFNDRNGKKDFKKNDTKRKISLQADDMKMVNLKKKNDKVMKPNFEPQKPHVSHGNKEPNTAATNGSSKIERHDNERQDSDNSDCPSKFLILCLNEIEKALREEGHYGNEEKPLFVDPWGIEFLKRYSAGKVVSEISPCSVKKIAWLVSIAADSIARKEKQGLSFSSPFLLFVVPSQEKAAMVRSVCKPLKALGIHTVSLHTGASIDHQIHGLRSCEPEFLVSTPERLLELVSLKAVDISGVSFLVIDGLESVNEGGVTDALKSIRQSISGNPRAVVFSTVSSYTCASVLENRSTC
ncbi:hypothetical protein Tsubulata_034347 [Turnera subulata]|uniref:DEAD/DEAH box helicase domain-containing protein n=1 Tax=Turnera subulata TaxID=218843 RepID=A0A9Q0GKQ0_9ROSI|nr:hypothetical protein Tsubulata_034347 [Turnera subulata]